MTALFEVPRVEEKIIDKNRSIFTIEPLYPGYGPTLGNALRRILLSSLPGTAISRVQIDGVAHEFSAIPHVKEDTVEIIMNLRKIVFISHSDEPITIELSAKGPKEVTAADFKPSSSVEIVNPGQHIATLDKSAKFNLEVTLEHGRGFRPTEDNLIGKSEIGRIAVDSVFSPITLVNLKIDHTRVGQMTNYDKIELEVTTNGTISAKDALTQAAEILVDHFNYIAIGKPFDESKEEDAKENPSATTETNLLEPKTKIEDLTFSARTINALVNSGIKTVAGLRRMSDLKLSEVKGLGRKGFEEVKDMLG